MGAAGIGPKAGCVIFAHGAALQQGFRSSHDKNGHSFVPQSAQMGLQLFNRLQLTDYPCGNQYVHSFCPRVSCIS
jgi:copper oxidase (laccase) domain-containing protein